MTKVKICGLTREQDIDFANEVLPEFIGFVFYPPSKRYVDRDTAAKLKERLDYRIAAVGVFVDEEPDVIAELVRSEIIDVVQLHGNEDNEYISRLRGLCECPLIQAFRVGSKEDIERAMGSDADFILLDSGMGSGISFDHSIIKDFGRPYFLAGGLDAESVGKAVNSLRPYAVDASSSLETNGYKDIDKMKAFTNAARKGK